MEDTQSLPLNSDVYFLIQRFLSSGLLNKTLKAFNEELEQSKLLPTRVDWRGNKHDRTVDDMIGQFPNIRPDYLLHLCHQAVTLGDRNISPKSFLSFRPNKYKANDILTNFRQLYNYVTRIHEVPIQNVDHSFNIANALRGREVSGPLSRQRITSPKLFHNMQLQRITVGHLSAVYCLLFDHSGKYIITGADDLLIKLWSSYTGRLISVFRGASSEITDIAINPENTLLAAGSIDHILRVWNLQNGTPVAVLKGHIGMITSVNFCPTLCMDVRYLISTSTDGSIAFWPYNYESAFNVDFKNNPVLYQEKIRPGMAQMICSSFSPGGTFLATGSADHHVRVYYMKGDEGPHRILEMEAHSDRVDSIQWAHSGLKFLSGSKDGMAIIWWFERQQWKSIHLDMAAKLVNTTNVVETDSKKLKVTMVCWNLADQWVITAVSDMTLKIWTSKGQLIKILTGHTDEIYVLEAHPRYDNVILSAGHDGKLFVWDILKGEILFKFLNMIEGQGFGGIYDVKWSPDGCIIGGSDSHGHLLIFGFGQGSPLFQQLPQELFFHTDYRPLVRDPNHFVLDEQTQIPPHLMPPPFLVDIDGNPYPPMLQRLVPGREFCNVNQLVPNIIIGNGGTQEVIQDLPQNHIESMERDAEEERDQGSSFRLGRRSSIRDHERIRQSTGDWQNDPSFEWHKNVLVQPLSRAILEKSKDLREAYKDAEMEEYQRQLRQRPHMISITNSSNIKKKEEKQKQKQKKKKPNSKYSTRSAVSYEYDEPLSSGNEYERETSGSSDWVQEERPVAVRSSKRRAANHSRTPESEIEDEDIEVEVYEDEDYNGREDFNNSVPSYSRNNGKKENKNKENKNKDRSKEKSNKNKENQKPAAPPSKVSRNGANRRAKTVSRRRKKRSDSSSDHHSSSSSESEFLQYNGSSTRGNRELAIILGPSTSGINQTSKLTKISEQYRLSEWLSETRPRKSPYYPQLGDEIVYFIQGHQLYLNAVEIKSVYEVSTKELPWNKMEIQPHEFCKVIGIQYEIKPPRLCCMKLALMDDEGRLTGKGFSVKFHDMPDVLDFFVLKQIYNTAISRSWKKGNKFRCMIDEEWWIGEIINKSPASDAFPNSSFLCYQIRWNNGEQERMSPWDMEPIDNGRIPEDESESIAVLEEELTSILYKTIQCDWPFSDLPAITKNIVHGITAVMELAIAEPFLVPVDINVYPSYAMVIEYPIDLSTIKSRFENRFYRRLIAAQFDIRYLATNAEKFNQKHSNIVKHAKILTELCLRIVRNCSTCVDVHSLYHRLVSSYDSSESQSGSDDSDSVPSTSKNSKAADDFDEWKTDAMDLLDKIWTNEDSSPFRKPVDLVSYPDYYQIVNNPMDLGNIKKNLLNDDYDDPQQFATDMRLIFSNSRLYTPNKKSRIYEMTSRLSKSFEAAFKKLLSDCKEVTKKQSQQKSTPGASEDSGSGGSNSNDAVSDEDSNTDNDDVSVNESKSESESPSESNMVRTRTRRGATKESEDEYQPKPTLNSKYVQSSSEDISSGDERIGAKRKSNLRQIRRRKKIVYDDSNSEESSEPRKRLKRIRRNSESDSSDRSSQSDSSNRREGNFMSQVSSRGRVRKLTEKAKSMFKKK